MKLKRIEEIEQAKARLIIEEIAGLKEFNDKAYFINKALENQVSDLQQQLASEQQTIAELREALEGMSELCGNYFDESQLVCERDKQIWAMMLKALSAKGPNEQP